MRSILMRVCVVVAIVILLAVPAAAQAEEAEKWEGNANFLVGWKWLDGDWGNLDSHDEFASMTSFGRTHWPVQIAIDFINTWDEGSWFAFLPDASTIELGVGVRKVWERGRVRPFLGGGLAWIRGELDFYDPGQAGWFHRDNAGAGFWIDGGVFRRIGNHFNLGFEARWSTAEITIDGNDLDAGGTHVGLLLGYGW